MTTKGIYHTLVTQLDKLARHNRQGSFRTKDRYYEAVKRFCAYLAAHYHLQKLENVSGKHLVSYVLYLQAQGKSASTIKTDLSAIRFFHDKMSHPRYTLPGNEELGVALERRRFGQQDRTWTNSEFGKLIGRAMAEEREDYILALYLARYPAVAGAMGHAGHGISRRLQHFFPGRIVRADPAGIAPDVGDTLHADIVGERVFVAHRTSYSSAVSTPYSLSICRISAQVTYPSATH